MSERDVLDVLQDMCNTIDYALTAGVSPAYPDTSIRAVLGRAVDALAEARNEVRRLGEADVANGYHTGLLVSERDEALAEAERLRKSRAELLDNALCGRDEALMRLEETEVERDVALAAIERVRAMCDDWERSGMEDGYPPPAYMAGLVRKELDGEA